MAAPGEDREEAAVALGHEGLAAWLARALGARTLRIDSVSRLGGGAIQDNWLLGLAVDGERRAVVLRQDASASIPESRDRQSEYDILCAVHEAGILVPRPLGFCRDPALLGRPFAVVEAVPGVGFGPRVVRDGALGGDRDRLVRRLGGVLARIHAVDTGHPRLACLGPRPTSPGLAEVARIRATLDGLAALRPALEWGLRWAERHVPDPGRVTLAHRDFRTGNYLVDEGGLTAILDWEFAGWSDPMSDLGWFCAECWRFGRPDLEAGGVGPRAAFYAGYEAESGTAVDDDAVRFWEVVAHLRWAVIALSQGARHASGREPSLALALTGRMAAELELAVLRATAPGIERSARAAA